jgi:transcriptional regulator with XRE-family HTH domain
LKSLKTKVGRLIKDRRKELGFKTQESLAVAIGTEQPTVARWESGVYFPSEEYIEKLKVALDVTDDFFYSSGSTQQSDKNKNSVGDETIQSLISRMDKMQNEIEILRKSEGAKLTFENIKLRSEVNQLRTALSHFQTLHDEQLSDAEKAIISLVLSNEFDDFELLKDRVESLFQEETKRGVKDKLKP